MLRIVSTLLLATTVTLAAGSVTLMAQSAPAEVVKAREDLMKSLWRGYYRDMSQAAKGEGDFQAVAVKATQATEQLKKFVTLFPQGSGRDAVPTTRAKPEIWTQRAEFEAAANTLAKETAAFGDAAKSGNVEAMKAQWAKVAEACGACHGGPAKSGGKFRFEEQ